MIKKLFILYIFLSINLFSNNMYGDINYKIEILNNKNEVIKTFLKLENINKLLNLFENLKYVDENKSDENLSIYKIINYYESDAVCVCEYKRKKFDYYKEKEIIIFENYDKIKINGILYDMEKAKIKLLKEILK